MSICSWVILQTPLYFWRYLLCLFELSVLALQLGFIWYSLATLLTFFCGVAHLGYSNLWSHTPAFPLGAHRLGWECVSRRRAERIGPCCVLQSFKNVSMCARVYTSRWVPWPSSLELTTASFPVPEEPGRTYPWALLFPRAVFFGWHPLVLRLWGREECPEPGHLGAPAVLGSQPSQCPAAALSPGTGWQAVLPSAPMEMQERAALRPSSESVTWLALGCPPIPYATVFHLHWDPTIFWLSRGIPHSFDRTSDSSSSLSLSFFLQGRTVVREPAALC